jgi:hypothetical protein
LLNDHLGSTAVTICPLGAKKAELRYKAWGETRHTSGTTPTSYRFTGQREEAYIKLYEIGVRWYAPTPTPRTILDNLGQIWCLDGCRPRQVGDGACQLEDAPLGRCTPSNVEGLRMQW